MTSRRAFLAAPLALLLPMPWARGAAPLEKLMLGTQPLALPDAILGEVMRRDRLLRAALRAEGLELGEKPFNKGADMIAPLGRGELQGVFFGDMPALTAASLHDIVVIGMIKQTFSALVASRYLRLQDLKGRRVAYAHGSTAHYTLMQALRTAGLGEADVKLVAMEISQMPGALARGEVDVFAAWEPAPTIALAEIKGAGVVYRGLNTAYFALHGDLVRQRPGAATALGAALLRAVNWLGRGTTHLDRAAGWVLAARQAYSGQGGGLTTAQVAHITRRELLEVQGAPLLPKHYTRDSGQLADEFRFLKDIGKLPPDSTWNQAASRLDSGFLRSLQRQGAKYRLREFDYDL